jgi:hypothetical protein
MARGRTCSTFYIEAWSRLLRGRNPSANAWRIFLQEGAALFQNTPFGATLGAYRPKDAESDAR